MNKVEVNGMLRKGTHAYESGSLYWLDVTRKSGTVDTLMVLSPDDGLTEGSVNMSGTLKAEYINGVGVPVFIVPESVVIGKDDGHSETVVTGVLKKRPECRKTHGGKLIASILVNVDGSQVPVILWGTTARNAEKTLNSGDMVKVSGRLQSREYTDRKKNQRHTTWELSATSIEKCGQDE